ncbi:MAG: hypothetical protein HKM02_07430, partial [Pseudomonadales bacterium]|nr:hypothetical protein [Pseudomonadales bacterium]
TSTTPTTSIPVPAAVQSALSGYKISVFAQNPTGSTHPDDIVQNGNHVFIGYQDSVNPDGSAIGTAPASGQVIEYDLLGNIVQTFTAPGHIDGLMAYDSNTLWVSADEDGNPQITVIKLSNNSQLTYTPDTGSTPLPHGGGMDDMKLINGQVYVSASAPQTTPKPASSTVTYSTDASGATAQYGVNSGPALYTVTLNSDGKTFHYVTALMSGITATQLPANTNVTLNMTDADSSAIDAAGDLVVDSQQDSELVFVHNPGSTQTVSVLPITLYTNPWPIDDVRWVPSTGNAPFMLVSDTHGGLVYRIDASAGFAAGNVYTSGQGSILQLDPTTGDLTPIFVGLNAPHGLNFITQ